MSTPVLQVTGLEAGYGRTKVLHGIDLTVAPGSITALLGPNGAGKTTLLRTLAGQLPVTRGSIAVDGVDATGASPHRRAEEGLCLVPEGHSVFRELTVQENLRLLTPPWVADADVDEVYDAFPILRERRKQIAGTMSGGQQQMLALGRCWLARPKLALLDEVSMGLAPRIVDEIFEALGRLSQRGVALLLVEQYVDRALALADHVHVLAKGRTAHSGPAGELDRERLLERYLGAADAAPATTSEAGGA